jgi:tetratricopeptide (TPR) repeat protein
MAKRIVAILFLTALCSAAPARGDVLILTHPDASWSVRLDLPGFEMKPPRMLRDRSQVWALGSNKETGVSLTAFVEKATKLRESSECRDASLKRMASARKKMSLSEHGDYALAESPVPEGASAQAGPTLLHAYLYHEDFCVDVQLSKQPYRPADREVLLKALDGLTTVPASKEEMARSAAYTRLSGPEEQIVLEAVQRLRAKDFNTAEKLLLPLCPEARRLSAEAAGSPECALRVALAGEARKLTQGEDLAIMYQRAGDLLSKDGRPDAALETFRKSLDIRPNDAETLHAIGNAHHDRRDLAAASATFTRSLELRPNDAKTMYSLAVNLVDQGKLVEADAMLDRVERADPKNGAVWFTRGEIQMQRGRYTEAMATFEKAGNMGYDEEKVRAKMKECRDALRPKKD